jgi:hypothetical protein
MRLWVDSGRSMVVEPSVSVLSIGTAAIGVVMRVRWAGELSRIPKWKGPLHVRGRFHCLPRNIAQGVHREVAGNVCEQDKTAGKPRTPYVHLIAQRGRNGFASDQSRLPAFWSSTKSRVLLDNKLAENSDSVGDRAPTGPMGSSNSGTGSISQSGDRRCERGAQVGRRRRCNVVRVRFLRPAMTLIVGRTYTAS